MGGSHNVGHVAKFYTHDEMMGFIKRKDGEIADLKTQRDALMFYVGAKRKHINQLNERIVQQRGHITTLLAQLTELGAEPKQELNPCE